ncbi:hypothetical protein ACTMU2_19230 [Cupriavidus basilensis]
MRRQPAAAGTFAGNGGVARDAGLRACVGGSRGTRGTSGGIRGIRGIRIDDAAPERQPTAVPLARPAAQPHEKRKPAGADPRKPAVGTRGYSVWERASYGNPQACGEQ